METIGLTQELGVALGELLGRARAAGAVTPRSTPDDLRRLLVGVHAAAAAGADPEGSADRYLAVKPGITGLWQVSGRSNTGYEERVRLDVHYVTEWKLTLDLLIMVKTVRTVLAREGAV